MKTMKSHIRIGEIPNDFDGKCLKLEKKQYNQ